MPLRFALRSLLNSPGFTIVALLTLALGIGVNTSMFSIVETLLFRSGPFPRPNEIVQIYGQTPRGEQRTFSVDEIREIRAQTRGLTSLTIIAPSYSAVAEHDRPTVRLSGVSASADFFATFATQPNLGRAFTPEETQPGRNQVIVLSDFGWRIRYGRDPSVIGRTVRIDGEPVEIIGVMPPHFDYPLLWRNAQYFRPLNFTEDQLANRDYKMFRLIGRLAPGTRAPEAAAQLQPLAIAQAQEYPEEYSDLRYQVTPLHETLVDDIGRRVSWMLVALSGFVLLLACANLANLQLARAIARSRELSIRSALGASRWRLIRHQLCESVILATAGGLLGLLIAVGVNRTAASQFRIGAHAPLEFSIAGSTFAVALGISLLAGVVFGLTPALLATRTNTNSSLKSGSRGSTGGRGQQLVRRVLVVTEVMIAMILVAGAGFMQRGFAQFWDRDCGWDVDRIVSGQIGIPEDRFETVQERVEFFERLKARINAMPGVENTAIATSLPIYGYGGAKPVLQQGQSLADAASLPKAHQVMVTPDYFATLGIDLVEGRFFPPDLPWNSPLLAIINESFARQLWPGQSAIGRRVAGVDSGVPTWFEVIGVVRDVEDAANLRSPETNFTFYRPYSQEPWTWVHLVVRAAAAPETLIEPLRKAVTEVDPEFPADPVGTARQMMLEAQENIQLAGKTLVLFAGLGLLLAVTGIYGVIASVVAQRMTEFGIRIALGARPVGVLALVVRYGLWLAGTGLILGLGGAFTLARVLGNFMPRLGGPDPLVLGGVALVLLGIAVVASLVPAWRATKVNPILALKTE